MPATVWDTAALEHVLSLLHGLADNIPDTNRCGTKNPKLIASLKNSHTWLCVIMRAYACLCVSMRVYACLCVLMREYA